MRTPDPDETVIGGPQSPTEVQPEAWLPEQLGRYQVERLLGEGAFGRVYLARDEQLGRSVAIKLPRRAAWPEEDALAGAEARLLATLDHPHIVPVYDVGRTDDGRHYVVSRFVEGTDLAAALKVRCFTPSEAAAIVMTVAEALHHAHLKGVVHRDVKPGNVLLDPNGTPHVTDFGLALRDDEYGTGLRLAGSPAYMSPEQARGEGHLVDGRSDVFSLGAVFYELLTGRMPFRGETAAQMLDRISTAEPKPPRQIDDRIPPELERVCLKALSKKVTDRYTTAKDMADDLRRISIAQATPAADVLANLPETFRERVKPRDLVDWLLLPLLLVWIGGLFLVLPAALAYGALRWVGFVGPGMMLVAALTGYVFLLVVWLVLSLSAVRGATVNKECLVLTRYVGKARRIVWTDLRRFSEASRPEAFAKVWLWPGFPPRGSITCCSTLHQYRIEWTGGQRYYFAPEDVAGFQRAVARRRPDLI